MYPLRYNISYIELDLKHDNSFTSDDGNVVTVEFFGERYSITDVNGYYGKYDKDISITLENNDEELHIQWIGKLGRSKVNIDDLGWVNLSGMNSEDTGNYTLAEEIADIIRYVEMKYNRAGFTRDKIIGESLNSRF
jgi:hypothetical protein